MCSAPPARSAVFQLDANHAYLGRTYVLKRVRMQRRSPEYGAGRRKGHAVVTRVYKDGHPFRVAAHEVSERQHVKNARPSMRVYLSRFPRRDPRLQNSRGVVLEQEAMRRGRCHKRIERIGPRPRLCLCIGHDQPSYSVLSESASVLWVPFPDALMDLHMGPLTLCAALRGDARSELDPEGRPPKSGEALSA
jgi:hypothetical protein